MKRRFFATLLVGAVFAGILTLVGCGLQLSKGEPFRIASGSENKALEPILERFGRERGFDVQLDYMGSVDIMLELQQGESMPYDAIWPANSLWITLGDSEKVVKHDVPIMHSPVIFGVKRSVAERLGWLGRDVMLADILAAVDAGKFKFAMTSATQSNSGCSAYLGFLHALAGSPDVLTHEHLADPAVQEKTKRLLEAIDRSSGSSGWLKDQLVADYDHFQAMVNYEAMLIEANRELQAQGKEPLVAIYPTDAVMTADSPLGYISHGDAKKAAFFRQLQDYLKSEPVQKEIMGLGRRTGLVGFDAKAADPAVFNPDWGIDVTRTISPVPLPAEPVIREALDLYQGGGLRKASVTAYVLDCSGSMRGEGIEQLKAAMRLLLDPHESKRYLMQPSARDIHVVIPFDSRPRAVIEARGNAPAELESLMKRIDALQPDGGTDIYAGIVRALKELDRLGPSMDSFPAVILMTDGQSQGSIATLRSELSRRLEQPVPVYSITFGQADSRQLEQVSKAAHGRVFDGQKDLAKAFREAKGYN